MKYSHTQTGFTLIEMAVVLVIIALLVGGVLAPLSTQKEQERREENQQLLDEALNALIGFAIVNAYLPCPDTDGDGVEDAPDANPGDCGRTQATSANSYPGRLPWVTLGINAEFDPWGEPHFVFYRVNGAFVQTFDLSAVGSGAGRISIQAQAADCPTGVNPVATNVPAVIWSGAKTDWSANADEGENADGDACFIYRQYNSVATTEYDDQMIWISPNVLFYQMVSAGSLP